MELVWERKYCFLVFKHKTLFLLGQNCDLVKNPHWGFLFTASLWAWIFPKISRYIWSAAATWSSSRYTLSFKSSSMWSTGGAGWPHGTFTLWSPIFRFFLFEVEVEVPGSGSVFSRFSFCARPPCGPLQQKTLKKQIFCIYKIQSYAGLPSLFPD